jgi:two-component system LytT family response regulator
VTQLIRVLVVDDEAPARAALRALLAPDPELEVVGACASGSEALAVLRAQPVDLLFLDVRMPGLDGLEVAREVRPRPPEVIFVTAYAEHALEAFDVEAVDYLLKPYDDERFARALERGKAAVRARRVAPPAASRQGFVERLTIPTRDGVQLVPVAEVDWFGAQDYYVEVHVGTRSYLLRRSLRKLEDELDPTLFARVHRSSIVNVSRIATLEPASHGERDLVLRDGTRLHLSRVYRDRLAALLRKG